MRIEKGKWYMCLKALTNQNGGKVFCEEGHSYLGCEDNHLVCEDDEVRMVLPGDAKEHFAEVLRVGDSFVHIHPGNPDAGFLRRAKTFDEITAEMERVFMAKNHDYGNSFEQSLDKFGLVAAACRMGDKMNRIESLVKTDAQVKDESIRDTFMDLANYAAMTVMWLDNKSEE